MDILNMDGGGQEPVEEEEEESVGIQLLDTPQCTKKVFQKLWKGTKDRVLKEDRELLSEEEVRSSFETLANGSRFRTMASAPKGRKLKFYFYAQEADSQCLHFVECNINLDTLTLSCTFKGTSDLYQDVAELFLR